MYIQSKASFGNSASKQPRFGFLGGGDGRCYDNEELSKRVNQCASLKKSISSKDFIGRVKTDSLLDDMTLINSRGNTYLLERRANENTGEPSSYELNSFKDGDFANPSYRLWFTDSNDPYAYIYPNANDEIIANKQSGHYLQEKLVEDMDSFFKGLERKGAFSDNLPLLDMENPYDAYKSSSEELSGRNTELSESQDEESLQFSELDDQQSQNTGLMSHISNWVRSVF